MIQSMAVKDIANNLKQSILDKKEDGTGKLIVLNVPRHGGASTVMAMAAIMLANESPSEDGTVKYLFTGNEVPEMRLKEKYNNTLVETLIQQLGKETLENSSCLGLCRENIDFFLGSSGLLRGYDAVFFDSDILYSHDHEGTSSLIKNLLNEGVTIVARVYTAADMDVERLRSKDDVQATIYPLPLTSEDGELHYLKVSQYKNVISPVTKIDEVFVFGVNNYNINIDFSLPKEENKND